MCFAGVNAIEWETQTSERTLRGRGISAAAQLRFPPRTYLCRRPKSDVREPAKRSRRSCGVAMSTYKETNRIGRKIRTARYSGRVALGNSPLEFKRRAEKEPIMANQSDHAPRSRRRLGSFSGGVDRPYGKRTSVRETSERSSALAHSPRIFSHPGGAGAKGDEIVGRRCRVGRADSAFATPDSPSRRGRTNIGEEIARTGHVGSNPIAFSDGGLSRAGKQKVLFANQLRGVDALAESPWPLWGEATRSGR